jgi:hypothetical protein
MRKVLDLVVAFLVLNPAVTYAREGREYVDGYGWANTQMVSACLNAVGAEETDQLHDGQWEEWLSCMAKTSR